MFIFNEFNGGFGTTVFRYMASVLIKTMYGGVITDDIYNTSHVITDDFFNAWMKKLVETDELENINGELFQSYSYTDTLTHRYKEAQQRFMYIANHIGPYKSSSVLDPTIMNIFKDIMSIPDTITQSHSFPPNISGFFMKGSFQHDDIYNKYKCQIVQWINHNPKEVIMCADFFKFYSGDLISDVILSPNEVVIHIPLGDLIDAGRVTHPFSLVSVLDKVPKASNIVLVTGVPKTYVEKLYLKFITDRYKIDLKICDSVMDEYNYIRNSKILISSLSPICWVASYFSTTIETIYFPDCDMTFSEQTFKQVVENTIFFEFKQIFNPELEIFLGIDSRYRINHNPENVNNTISTTQPPPVQITALSRIMPPLGSRYRRGPRTT